MQTTTINGRHAFAITFKPSTRARRSITWQRFYATAEAAHADAPAVVRDAYPKAACIVVEREWSDAEIEDAYDAFCYAQEF